MPTRQSNSPQLPNEIILLVLDKSKEILESEVESYVRYHKHNERDHSRGASFNRNHGECLLYHSRLGFDDCVFSHQCWTYTALRLISSWAYRHVADWTNARHVDGLIKKYEGIRDVEQPWHARHPLYHLRSDHNESLEDIMARLWPDPEKREKAWLTIRSDFVPVWDKFMEAHSYMPEGTQTLPWQAGYNKAAALGCIHLDEHIHYLLRQQPERDIRLRPGSYFGPWRAQVPPGFISPPGFQGPLGNQIAPSVPVPPPLPPVQAPPLVQVPHPVQIPPPAQDPPPVQVGAQSQVPAPMQTPIPAQIPASTCDDSDVD